MVRGWWWLVVGMLVALPSLGGAEECTGVFTTVTSRYQLRYANANAAHPQFSITKPNRWNLIDFNEPQEIQGKPTVPALPPTVCAVDLSAVVGIAPGKVANEHIAVWLDFTTDPEGEEPCRPAYTDSANFGPGVRDTIGGLVVPLREGRLWWAWCAHSNYDAATGRFVPGPNILSPRARLVAPYSTAFVNLGLVGWRYRWVP